IPAQEVSVLLEALRKILFTKPRVDCVVSGVRLIDELLRWCKVTFLAPVDCDLRLGHRCLRTLCHSLPPDGRSTRQSGWGCRRTQTRASIVSPPDKGEQASPVWSLRVGSSSVTG